MTESEFLGFYKERYAELTLGGQAFISGWPDYTISRDGVVKHWSGRVMKPTMSLPGYLRVSFSCYGRRQTLLVHRLVAIAFIPNPENKPFINHLNGNPSDPRDTNLEWATASENQIHSFKVLGRTPHNRLITPDQVDNIRLLKKQGIMTKEIANKLNVKLHSVYNVLSGQYNEIKERKFFC